MNFGMMKTINSKPIPFRITKSGNHALKVQIDQGVQFYGHLHYHPEFQITAIIQGEGVLYAGNSMTGYEKTDVFFIGSNVPHLLKNQVEGSVGENNVKSISLFFDYNSFGHQFFEINEMQQLKSLLQKSKRVIKVEGELKPMIYHKIVAMEGMQNESLVINFLEVLSLIHQSKNHYINTENYMLTLNVDEGGRLNEVLEYTFTHYKTDIKIEEVARIACLSRSQFSYFFKMHTGKTYIQFLNELRIEKSCLLLKKDPSMSVDLIGFEVGFNNVSNFTRQFKKVKSKTPSDYRKLWVLR